MENFEKSLVLKLVANKLPILLASSSYTAPNGLPARFLTFRILVCLQLRLLEGQLQPLKLIWYIDTGTEVSSNLAIS